MASEIILRDVRAEDLPIFFEYQLDPAANYMAAFIARDPTDRDAFKAHWTKVLGDDANVTQTILCDGQVAGNIACFGPSEEREVGYWIGKHYWGKGIATRALSAFLCQVTERPLYAYVAKDNIASLRVLAKCGFTIFGEHKEFSNARGQEVEQFILRLPA
jgi:RimJ/RimL family protein N-acetyltransferase